MHRFDIKPMYTLYPNKYPNADGATRFMIYNVIINPIIMCNELYNIKCEAVQTQRIDQFNILPIISAVLPRLPRNDK